MLAGFRSSSGCLSTLSSWSPSPNSVTVPPGTCARRTRVLDKIVGEHFRAPFFIPPGEGCKKVRGNFTGVFVEHAHSSGARIPVVVAEHGEGGANGTRRKGGPRSLSRCWISKALVVCGSSRCGLRVSPCPPCFIFLHFLPAVKPPLQTGPFPPDAFAWKQSSGSFLAVSLGRSRCNSSTFRLCLYSTH